MNDRLDCKQKEIETLRTEVEELRKKLDETFEKLSATEQSARSAEAEAVKLGSRAEAAEQTVAETARNPRTTNGRDQKTAARA